MPPPLPNGSNKKVIKAIGGGGGGGHAGSSGAIDRGSLCRMSNLRNGNVPCPYFTYRSIHDHVDFKMV